MLTYTSLKRLNKENCIFELNSDDKILSTLITKTCRSCTFLIQESKRAITIRPVLYRTSLQESTIKTSHRKVVFPFFSSQEPLSNDYLNPTWMRNTTCAMNYECRAVILF